MMCGQWRNLQGTGAGGNEKYIQQHNIGENPLHVLSGANVNFHVLRYVSERCELGEQREGVFAVTITEEGSFLRFLSGARPRVVTEFNYRYSGSDEASVFVSVRADEGPGARQTILDGLSAAGFSATDLSDDEMAKLHVRYMVGGRPSAPLQERLFSFEFPGLPGALLKFLETLGTLEYHPVPLPQSRHGLWPRTGSF